MFMFDDCSLALWQNVVLTQLSCFLALDLRHVCLFFSRPRARGNLFLEVSVWMGKCFCRPVRLILRWSTAASPPLTYHKHSRKQQFCVSFCATSSSTTSMSLVLRWHGVKLAFYEILQNENTSQHSLGVTSYSLRPKETIWFSLLWKPGLSRSSNW